MPRGPRLAYHAFVAGQESNKTRFSHESRLLVLTIAVCVVVLLLLARLRFPEPPASVETTVQPLQRLAATASYDSLAADIQRVQDAIVPNLLVLRTAPRADRQPRSVLDVLAPGSSAPGIRHVPALRINADTALAAITPDVRIDGIVTAGPITGTASVLGVDPLRTIGRIRVPAAQARPINTLALSALRAPVYVVAVEGTQAGVTLRPVFLGRGDRLDSARWGAPLLPLGGTSVSAGALLLSLAGDFLGCVVIENGSLAVAGARDVLAIVDRLAIAPTMSPATLGISVQPLTPSLATALRAERGVVVANVDPAGPAADALRPGDVLTGFAGMPVNDVDRFLVQVAASPIDVPIAASVVRDGQTREIQLVPAAATRRNTEREPLAFQRLRDDVTRVVRQAGQTGYADTGLQDGDIVVAAAGLPDPTPAQLRRLLETAQPGTLIPFTIRRGGEQRVIAVRAGARTDGARN